MPSSGRSQPEPTRTENQLNMWYHKGEDEEDSEEDPGSDQDAESEQEDPHPDADAESQDDASQEEEEEEEQEDSAESSDEAATGDDTEPSGDAEPEDILNLQQWQTALADAQRPDDTYCKGSWKGYVREYACINGFIRYYDGDSGEEVVDILSCQQYWQVDPDRWGTRLFAAYCDDVDRGTARHLPTLALWDSPGSIPFACWDIDYYDEFERRVGLAAGDPEDKSYVLEGILELMHYSKVPRYLRTQGHLYFIEKAGKHAYPHLSYIDVPPDAWLESHHRAYAERDANAPRIRYRRLPVEWWDMDHLDEWEKDNTGPWQDKNERECAREVMMNQMHYSAVPRCWWTQQLADEARADETGFATEADHDAALAASGTHEIYEENGRRKIRRLR